MAASEVKLPPGFELDQPKVPDGFVLDQPERPLISTDIPTGVRGGLEAAAAIGTGMIAGPISGVGGIVGSVLPGPPGQGASVAEKIRHMITYSPRTDMGKRSLEAASYPFEKLSQGADIAGGAVTDFAMRSGVTPEVAAGMGTITNAGIQLAPALITKGAKAPAETMLDRSRVANALPADATEATAAGYTLTPSQLNAGTVRKALEGLSGTAKMEKLASGRNQKVTNRIIQEDLGLPIGKQITEASLEASRLPDYQAYEAVKGSVKLIKPDAKFKNDLQDLRGDFTNAANAYPDLMKNDKVETLIDSLNTTASPRSMVELTRKLRKDAAANLKAFDDPEKQALGMAQRNASAAMEDLIERALTSVGKDDLVKDWKTARTHLAKTYDTEAALNETTGDISARYLAKLYGKGRPLTGGMETSAKAAQAFEGSMRDPAKMRDTSEFGFGDLLMGSIGGAAGAAGHGAVGGLPGLGLVAARPIARRLLLSSGTQTGGPGFWAQTAADVTRNPNAAALLAAPSIGLNHQR